MKDPEPEYIDEIRWWVEGTPYHFGEERQARAFARPGQVVIPTLRTIRPPIPPSEDTGEFVIMPE